jgi:hypothetical protein
VNTVIEYILHCNPAISSVRLFLWVVTRFGLYLHRIINSRKNIVIVILVFARHRIYLPTTEF